MLTVPHPFSLAVFENWLYFTDWTRLAVMRTDKFGLASESQKLYNNSEGGYLPMAITAFHRSVQPNRKLF